MSNIVHVGGVACDLSQIEGINQAVDLLATSRGTVPGDIESRILAANDVARRAIGLPSWAPPARSPLPPFGTATIEHIRGMLPSTENAIVFALITIVIAVALYEWRR